MTLYLDQTLVFPNRLDNPMDWLSPYSHRPLYVEIGFGNGDFLRHLAGSLPEGLHVGIEVSQKCIDKAARKAAREKLDNIRLLFGDARFLLRECFPDETVDGVFMNFPCPWPKQKHARRRVTTQAFVDVLGSVLKLGGTFELMTDERWYAEEVVEAMGKPPYLEVVSFHVNPVRPLTTKYEKKWLEMGKDTHQVRVRKTSHHSTIRMAGGMESMHVVVEGKAFDGKDLDRFKNKEGGDDNAHWVLSEAYTGADGSGLIKAITVDEGFEQRFYILLANREGKCVVKVDPSSSPYKTPAVRKALENAAALLRDKAL